MKKVSVSDFKKHCLSFFSEVQKTKEQITITKYGQSIALIKPVEDNKTTENPLKDSVIFEENLISPIDEDWDAA